MQLLLGLKSDLALNMPRQAAKIAPEAMPLSALETSFKGKGPWKKGLPRILETRKALGRARREGDGWRG